MKNMQVSGFEKSPENVLEYAISENSESVEIGILVNDLHFRYTGRNEDAIKRISFSVKKGEIFGFLGPSGAGKTTVLKILVGLLKNYKGNSKILGKETYEWNKELYIKIGVSPEQPNHFSKLTGLENIKYFCSLYDLKNVDYLELFEMVNLDSDMNKLVAEYSKGMRMRLNFIRAILHDPKILFLDEPTTGLDPIHAKKIKNLILEQKNKGKTIFLTTHNMDLAEELCDRVCIINNGEIKKIINPKNIYSQNSIKKVSIQYISNDNCINEEIIPLENFNENPDVSRIFKNHTVIRINTIEPSLEEIFILLAEEEK
jgi:fluoroquinolone transport system ATP-binding protein